MTMEEILSAHEEGIDITIENWNDFYEGLLALELPINNVLFTYINRLQKGYDIDQNDFIYIKKSISKLLDATISAAGNSSKISENFRDGTFGCDREFIDLIYYIKNNSIRSLVSDVYNNLLNLSTNNAAYYRLITAESQGWYMENNWLDGINGANNSLIPNRMKTLKENVNELEWLYENLADSLSRLSLNALIKYWLTWDYTDWKRIALNYCDVVDTSIFSFYDDEVFVDCGAYLGDTVLQFIRTVNSNYKRIYTYDIASIHIELSKKNLALYHNIVIKHKGTGDTNTEMNILNTNQVFSGNKLVSDSNGALSEEKVTVVKLDDDIKEPITFLKIDVEGMDKETLLGASSLIRKYHPKINIDAYHKLADIVEVPMLIKSIDQSYSIYLRLPLVSDAHIRFPFPTIMAV
ncbi:MAG: FkbM family methyltransferase [Oscillospiraceae bacterium]|nr:FkbM family methyltransferase [Oscillospiraceae bacterium]